MSTDIQSISSDIPRRMLTICIGAPIVFLLLSDGTSSKIFLTIVHFLCGIEWITALVPRRIQKQALQEYRLKFILRAWLVLSVAISVLIMKDEKYIGNAIIRFFCLNVASRLLGRFGNIDAKSMDAYQHVLDGFLFITTGFSSLLFISVSAGFMHALFFALVVWNGDTGALIAGRLGKFLHLKYPSKFPSDLVSLLVPSFITKIVFKVSPKKTMTGFLGGLVLSVITAFYLPFLLNAVFHLLCEDKAAFYCQEEVESRQIKSLQEIVPGELIETGLLLSMGGICGDLFESAIKRSADQKDSGKLLPGHGGLMDRMDSMLFAASIYVLYVIT